MYHIVLIQEICQACHHFGVITCKRLWCRLCKYQVGSPEVVYSSFDYSFS